MEFPETHPSPTFRIPKLKILGSLAVLAGLLALNGCSSDSVTVTTADTQCAQLTDGGSVDVGSGLPGDPSAPEPASGYRPKSLVTAKSYMVVSANP